MLDLAARAGVNMLHVPYNGAPPALTDTIAGRTDCMFALLAAAKGHLDAGRVRGLAVPTAQRAPQLPNVPTFIEKGFADFTWGGWYSVQAPLGTPAHIIERLNEALTQVFADPRTIEFMATQGLAPAPMGSAALRARIERELPLHRTLMQRAGLEPT